MFVFRSLNSWYLATAIMKAGLLLVQDDTNIKLRFFMINNKRVNDYA